MNAHIMLLDGVFNPEGTWTVRLLFPGIDGGAAVALEGDIERATKAEVEAVIGKMMEMLPGVIRDVEE